MKLNCERHEAGVRAKNVRLVMTEADLSGCDAILDAPGSVRRTEALTGQDLVTPG